MKVFKLAVKSYDDGKTRLDDHYARATTAAGAITALEHALFPAGQYRKTGERTYEDKRGWRIFVVRDVTPATRIPRGAVVLE